MDEYVCLLISIVNDDILEEYAVKFKRDKVKEETLEYPMELENRKRLADFLPGYVVQGPIMAIREIDGIYIK